MKKTTAKNVITVSFVVQLIIFPMGVDKNRPREPTATASRGQDVVVVQPHIEHCHFCGKKGTFGIDLLICSSCRVAKYCDVLCQKKHWSQHQVYCKALNISSGSNEIHISKPVTHLSPNEQAKMVLLSGNNCIIDCNLNDMKTKVLWHTGSQVSVVSRRFLKNNFRGLEIRNLADLLCLAHT